MLDKKTNYIKLQVVANEQPTVINNNQGIKATLNASTALSSLKCLEGNCIASLIDRQSAGGCIHTHDIVTGKKGNKSSE